MKALARSQRSRRIRSALIYIVIINQYRQNN